MPDVAEIAGRLSEAQRLAIILWDGGDDKDLSDMMGGLKRDGGIAGLVDAGICYRPTISPPRATSLTPLGLAVRAYLENSLDDCQNLPVLFMNAQVYRDENMRLHYEIQKLEAEVKKQRSLRDQYRAAWEAEKARAALGDTQ